jgi:ABC-2 type transport system ATP-binding protein
MEVKKKIGYLPENNPLYYDLYVKEFLDFALQLHQPRSKNRDRKIREIIDSVGLNIEQHKKIGQLSRGYKQRVGLAQALIHDPEVLILDEPTSGLDPNQLADIRALIKELGRAKTILFSTHIMQEVQAVCDRVIIINKGKIVADDKPSGLQHATDVQVEVEFADPVEQSQLHQIEGLVSIEKISGTEYIVRGDDSAALRKSIFAFAVASGNPILTMKAVTKSLETVFQQLTGSA